jgi:hypothetical protein
MSDHSDIGLKCGQSDIISDIGRRFLAISDIQYFSLDVLVVVMLLLSLNIRYPKNPISTKFISDYSILYLTSKFSPISE